MTNQPGGNTSDTARLMNQAPGFAVGWQDRVVVPAPAAGANWKYTVDGRYYERVLAVHFTFNTSAVVANRFPVVALTDNNGFIVTSVPGGSGIAASNGVITDLVVGGPAYNLGNTGNAFGFLPDLLVPPGWIWQSQTFGIDVGDAYTGISLLVQRFPNDAAVVSAIG